jgi:hypothetical protein
MGACKSCNNENSKVENPTEVKGSTELDKEAAILKIKHIQAFLRLYLENKRNTADTQSGVKHSNQLQDKEIIKAPNQEYVENYKFTNGAIYTGNIISKGK